MPDRRALLLIIDGLGFSRQRGAAVAADAWSRLARAHRTQLERIAGQVARDQPASAAAGLNLARGALYPVSAEALKENTASAVAIATLDALRTVRDAAGRDLRITVDRAVREAAREQRYVPWAAVSAHLDSVRNRNRTVPTHASGKWAGFEDLVPPVQGNSDTGHQQIANFSLAPQTTLEITDAIRSGEFFRNAVLREAVKRARDGAPLNFCFMISGAAGSDGRVHSAWNHLDAFLKLVFEQASLPPSQVRMQAILDGRDCPGDSSIRRHGDTGDYLGMLERSLGRYRAQSSLAWVIGRNISMDRDYREPNVRADYLLLTKAVGQTVEGFGGARAAIRKSHTSGLVDGDVPPLVVVHEGEGAREVGRREVFVNLNFRADRQRAKTASLLGARTFLANASRRRGASWDMGWLRNRLDLHVVTLSEYHPDLTRAGARAAFPASPQAGNLLALFPGFLPGESYSLIGESNKSAHMGFFLRGRRESPVAPDIERRTIVPSASRSEGVESDTDFYKTPHMRAPEIADLVSDRLMEGNDRLICANLSNCDMLGHLLPVHFDAAVRAYQAIDEAVARLAPAAAAAGYDMVITSDHGNVEDDTPSHSVNDVLTTIVPASGETGWTLPGEFQARLYDVSWTIARLLGIESASLRYMKRQEAFDASAETSGRPLIELAPR